MATVIVRPTQRQAVVIVEQGSRLLSCCLACRTRAKNGEGPTINLYESNVVRPPEMTDAEYRAMKAESHMRLKTEYPEAEIVWLTHEGGIDPLELARAEAERLVS